MPVSLEAGSFLRNGSEPCSASTEKPAVFFKSFYNLVSHYPIPNIYLAIKDWQDVSKILFKIEECNRPQLLREELGKIEERRDLARAEPAVHLNGVMRLVKGDREYWINTRVFPSEAMDAPLPFLDLLAAGDVLPVSGFNLAVAVSDRDNHLGIYTSTSTPAGRRVSVGFSTDFDLRPFAIGQNELNRQCFANAIEDLRKLDKAGGDYSALIVGTGNWLEKLFLSRLSN